MTFDVKPPIGLILKTPHDCPQGTFKTPQDRPPRHAKHALGGVLEKILLGIMRKYVRQML